MRSTCRLLYEYPQTKHSTHENERQEILTPERTTKETAKTTTTTKRKNERKKEKGKKNKKASATTMLTRPSNFRNTQSKRNHCFFFCARQDIHHRSFLRPRAFYGHLCKNNAYTHARTHKKNDTLWYCKIPLLANAKGPKNYFVCLLPSLPSSHRSTTKTHPLFICLQTLPSVVTRGLQCRYVIYPPPPCQTNFGYTAHRTNCVPFSITAYHLLLLFIPDTPAVPFLHEAITP